MVRGVHGGAVTKSPAGAGLARLCEGVGPLRTGARKHRQGMALLQLGLMGPTGHGGAYSTLQPPRLAQAVQEPEARGRQGAVQGVEDEGFEEVAGELQAGKGRPGRRA